MPPSGTPNKRIITLLAAALGLITLVSLIFSRHQPPPTSYSSVPIHQVNVDSDILKGGVIAGKIENATVKAELGQAAWKVLHTTMAKFPDQPTQDEQTALFSFLHLFARLYPCGECAGHFRQILNKFPPQVSTRSTAAAWACHVHNEVNKSLQKELFDCSNIGDFYDCGCAEEGDDAKVQQTTKSERIDLQVERLGPTKGG